jgi:hypothetical protein
MAEVASNPTEPVPLDTIPVSQEGEDKENTATNGSNGKVVTVFDDPSNFNVKHQLQHSWTLWFTKPPSGKQDWNELLKEVITFDVPSLNAVAMIRRTDRFFTEQHHLCFRARAEVRLPPLQARCPP